MKPEIRQIRASAGSGKTWRLTSDYIDKLNEISLSGKRDALAAKVSGILAVTFTNAAANEMRQRVLRRLKQAALKPDGDQAASTWVDLFLSDLNLLNIRTIDSLLHQIVRASALGLGISPEYEVEFNAGVAFAPYIEMFFERARKEGYERDLLAKACAALLKDDESSGFIAGRRIAKPLNAVLSDALTGKFAGLASEAEIDRARKALPTQAAIAAGKFLDLVATHSLNWKNKNNKNSIERYAGFDFPAGPSSALYKDINRELFKDAQIPNEVREAFLNLKQAGEAYHYDLYLLDKGEQLKPFLELAGEIAQIFREEEQLVALQSMVSVWACQALTGNTGVSDALCRMGTRLSHFLVDEFQDTSKEQWSVLRSLVLEAVSRGGSFTWVGDIKQSIYGWRGGDPDLFDAALTDVDLTAVVPDPVAIRLTSNWRSAPQIVEHTNTFFGPFKDRAFLEEIAGELLEKEASTELRGQAVSRLEAAFRDITQKCEKSGSVPGYVLAEMVAGDTSEEGGDAVSERLIELLLTDIGLRRPWSDVLILCRRNEEVSEIAAKLGEARIPVITENGLLLNQNELIIQIIAFLQFLDNPRDDASFWTVLTGSILGGHSLCASELNQSDLAEWAGGRTNRGPLWQQFRTDYPQIWKKLISPFLNRSQLTTAYDTVAEWYKRLSVERRFPENITMLRRLLETLHLAENSGFTSIAAFLEYWTANGDQEKAPMPENMNAVRIMTIHKAKGLEAPVVLALRPEYNIRASGAPVLHEINGISVIARINKKAGPPYFREIMRQGLEALNLLYVALTRASEELYILFPASSKSTKKSLKRVISKLIDKAGWKLPYAMGEKPKAKTDHIMELTEIDPPSPGQTDELEEDWRPMNWFPRLKIYHSELASTVLTPVQRGAVLHSCLEFMTFAGDAAASADIALKNGISASSIAVPDAEIQSLLDDLVWFAENTPVSDWLSRGWREQPLVNSAGALLRADMIVPEDWGTLVIDYKSGAARPEDEIQIREYMRTLAQSGQFAGEICGLLVYLDQRGFKKIRRRKGINLVKTAPGNSAMPAEDAGLSSVLPNFP